MKALAQAQHCDVVGACWWRVLPWLCTCVILLHLPLVKSGVAVIPAEAALDVAYFEFDDPPSAATFIFALRDPAKIQEARDILSGQQPSRHVSGRIVKHPAAYNAPWSYHLDPESIVFFSFAVEVCDASIEYVEEHLDQVGDTILPGSLWCPWNSRLIREVLPMSTPTPTIEPTATPTTLPTPTATSTPRPALTPQVYLPIVTHGSCAVRLRVWGRPPISPFLSGIAGALAGNA